jgi:hypothetical protein
MSSEIPHWEQASQRVAAACDSPEDARGWINTRTDEVVIRRRIPGDTENLPEYRVSHFLRMSERGRGTNRSILFRGDSPADLDARVTALLKGVDVPSNPGRFDTAISPTAVRRKELSTVDSIRDWAHLTGAECYQTEKIGTRKQSSGMVAIFDGTSRWGNGAYVALASVTGPGGEEFASVGYQPNGFYATDKHLSGSPFEVTSPAVEFDGATLKIKGVDGSNRITVTAKTGNPDQNIRES